MDICDFSSENGILTSLQRIFFVNLGGVSKLFFLYNVIVTFRGEGVEHVTFWFGTIGLGMSLGLFGLQE